MQDESKKLMTTSTSMAVNFISEQTKRIVTKSQGSRL